MTGNAKNKIDSKGIIRFLCMLAAGVFLLPACGKTKEGDKADIVAEADHMDIGADFEYHHVTESENGYYFWERMSDDQFYPRLMFMDKKSGRVVPLCNKPDCMHDSEGCNARFPYLCVGEDGFVKEHIQYYQGSLYAIGLSSDQYVSLFRIQADGSEWEIDTRLYRTDYAATGHWGTPEVLFDDGYVYFIDRMQKKMKLERVPLGGSATEVIFEGDGDAAEVQIHRIKSDENNIFFEAYLFCDENIEHARGALYRFDKTDEICSIVKEELVAPYSVRNGWVYYGSQGEICRCPVEGGEPEVLGNQPIDVPCITLTRHYIILCDHTAEGGLLLYDYAGTQIAKVSGELRPTWYFGGDSEILFAECVCDNKTRLCYLDLTRPLDELQWEELKAE